MQTEVPKLELEKVEKKYDSIDSNSVPSSQRVPNLIEQYEALMKQTPKFPTKVKEEKEEKQVDSFQEELTDPTVEQKEKGEKDEVATEEDGELGEQQKNEETTNIENQIPETEEDNESMQQQNEMSNVENQISVLDQDIDVSFKVEEQVAIQKVESNETVKKSNYEKLIDQLLLEVSMNKELVNHLQNKPDKETTTKFQIIETEKNEIVDLLMKREQKLLNNIVNVRVEFESSSSNDILKTIFLVFVSIFVIILVLNKFYVNC
eukprot:gene920-9829_t